MIRIEVTGPKAGDHGIIVDLIRCPKIKSRNNMEIYETESIKDMGIIIIAPPDRAKPNLPIFRK